MTERPCLTCGAPVVSSGRGRPAQFCSAEHRRGYRAEEKRLLRELDRLAAELEDARRIKAAKPQYGRQAEQFFAAKLSQTEVDLESLRRGVGP